MKKQQEVLNKPLSEKPSEQEIQRERKKIMEEELREKRFSRTNLPSTSTSKTFRKK